jgi:hypothetical protein
MLTRRDTAESTNRHCPSGAEDGTIPDVDQIAFGLGTSPRIH